MTMLELIFSPPILALLAGAFSLIAGISLCAHFLDRSKRRRAARTPRQQAYRQ